MKKLLSLFLVFAMLISALAFSVFSEEAEASKISQAELTNALGITDFTEEMLSESITRQEFAKILYKLVTGTELNEQSKESCVFSDVTDAAYIPYVNAMHKAGLIGGYSDGTFKGDKPLTATEAATFLIRAVGHDVLAEAKGGYPAGYLSEARGLGFFSGFDFGLSEELTKGGLAVILKNALIAETEIRDTWTDEGKIEFSGKKTTLLYSVFGILKAEGVVTGTDITRLYGESSVPPWHIEIDEKLYDIGETSPNHLLGMKVEAYYTEEDSTLVFIGELEGKNKTVEIPNNRILAIRNNKIAVDEGNGKTKEYNYGKLTPLIYNMSSTEDALSMELIEGKDGTVTLIDNNKDGSWDVISVMAGKDIVIDYTDSVERAVYDRTTGEKTVLDNRNANPFVSIVDVNGKRVNIGVLKTNDVLTVYESRPDASQGYIRAVYSNKRVSAQIDGISEDEGRGWLTCGSEIYPTTYECYEYCLSKVTLGEKVDLLLNAEGKVAGIDFFKAGEQQYGILIKCQVVANGLENKAFIRLMNRYGAVVVTEFADKVTVDGITYKKEDDALYSHLKAASVMDIGVTHESVYSQLLKYTLDEAGKIEKLDTIIDKVENGGYIMANGEEITSGNVLYRGTNGSGTYYSDAKNIMGGVVVSPETVIFTRPALAMTGSDAAEKYGNEENYGVRKSLSGTTYVYSSYYEDISKISASALTVNESADSTTSAYNTTFSVFDKITLTVDADGVSCYKLYFWQDGNRKSKLCNKNAVFRVTGESVINALGLEGVDRSQYTAEKLKKGDLFRFSTDNNGKISAFDLFYRPEGKIKIQDKNPTSWAAYERLALGYVYRTYSDGLSFVQSDERVFTEGTSKIEYMKDPACAILIYDSSKPESQRLFVGTAKDAKAFSRYGEDCSVMFLQSKYGNPRSIYVIR